MIMVLPLILLSILCVQTDMYAAPKRAIVVGASSGMGKEVAKLLAADGYEVGLAARRIALLEALQQEIPTTTYITQMDVSKPDDAVAALHALIDQMGGLDLLVISVTGFWDCDFASTVWDATLPILAVDVIGFFALAKTGLHYFEQQGSGHLVGFSSIDALHGAASYQTYSGAKAFCSRYLEAERNHYIQRNMPIYVTEICPGWVNTKADLDFTTLPQAYWVETLEDASREIMEAIRNKTDVAFITKRWQKVAHLLATIPNDLYNALCARPGGSI